MANLFRMLGVIGQCLCISDHDIDLIVKTGILKADTFGKRADIMTDMKPSGRAVTGQNNFFSHGDILSFLLYSDSAGIFRAFFILYTFTCQSSIIFSEIKAGNSWVFSRAWVIAKAANATMIINHETISFILSPPK